MTVSTDYESDSIQMLTDMQEELSPLIDGDTIIKTAHIDVSYQKSEPGLVWGKWIKDKNFTIKNDYPVTTVNNLIDTEIIAELKKNSKISDVTHVLETVKEIIELLSDLKLEKYPILLAHLHGQVKESLDDTFLFDSIKMYQLVSTKSLSDENPEKIRALAFAQLSLESPEVQNLLASVRLKINETSPTDLSKETRTYLITTLRIFVEDLEGQKKEFKEQEATLQLPADSEKVRQLIAPMHDKILEKNKDDEANKFISCYSQAMRHMRLSHGEKQLSSMNVKLVYIKRSDPYNELVFEKKFPNRLLQRPA
jgi:hypothetical protein